MSEIYLLKTFDEMFKNLEEAENWSIEGLQIIPRSLVIKIIEEYKRRVGFI